jgi:hypothetical protein
VIDQLTTTDPQAGNQGRLATDQPVVLAWGRQPVLDVSVEGQAATQVSNVLYEIPVPMAIHGHVVFAGDLLTTTIVQTDAGFFSKDPSTFTFGRGSATVSYRPLPFSGTFDVSHVRFALNFGGDIGSGAPGDLPIAPIDDRCLDPKSSHAGLDCPNPVAAGQADGIPDVEVFDRVGGGVWHRLPHPGQGTTYDLADPARYVDPATGTLLIRFVNDSQDGVGFTPTVAIEGIVQ